MSRNLYPWRMALDVEHPPPTDREPSRPIAELAASCEIDPRIPALVPGFDAPFFQAGLAGYSDGAMRLIARRHGSPYCVTEALLDRTLIQGGKGQDREDPDRLAAECGTGDLEENRLAGLDDHPIAGQVMGTTPDEMAMAAALLADMGHDVVDVNFACPVRKIARRNRGGHFLTAPDEAIDVLRAVREAVPSSIPTSIKLRRSWDDTPEMAAAFERIFETAYELGYAWTTIHGRTVAQKYQGASRWEFLRELTRRHPDKIVFGSGDIWTVEDIFAMIDITGVHAVSVARGCIGNPWIFRQARQMMAGEPATPPLLAEQRQVLLDHFELSLRLHGEHRASRMMRKFGIKFSLHHPESETVKKRFIQCKSVSDWHQVITEVYGAEEPAGTLARTTSSAPNK